MSFLLMQNLQVVIRNLTYNSISFNISLIQRKIRINLLHILFVWDLNRNSLTLIPQKLELVMNVLCLILYFLLWPSIFSNSLNLRIMSFSYNSSKRSCKDEDESIYRLITFYSQGIYIGSTPLFNLMRCLRTLSEI